MQNITIANEIKYLEVLLPLPLYASFYYTYSPVQFPELQKGSRVVVPFGKQKIYSGIVIGFPIKPPVGIELKPVIDLLDEKPIIKRPQIEFWSWLADYYCCTMGEVLRAALPSGYRLESQSVFTINDDFTDFSLLVDTELIIWNALKSTSNLTTLELQKLCGIPSILPIIKRLLDKEAIEIYQSLNSRYKAKTERYITINADLLQPNYLEKTFALLKRATKQLELLMAYLNETESLLKKEPVSILKSELLLKSGSSSSIVSQLIQKEIFIEEKREVDRLNISVVKPSYQKMLNAGQQKAFNQINEFFEKGKITLLHGVTSSGKTEIYIHLIKEQLKQDRQVLYLLPEIGLTTQLTHRLAEAFGDALCVYHSGFTDNERVEMWRDLKDNKRYKVIIGARSALFLPFTNLGLVIVDEEHDPSYKQYDPAPRYHARDAVTVLASLHHANVLLGTATPSVESYYNALAGKYGLVKLNERYQGILMPKIVKVDLREAYRKRQMRGHFSVELLQRIRIAIESDKQVILFQNRRGYSPSIECPSCGWTAKCKSCDVSLTMHKKDRRLHCHYCGYSDQIPQRCPACGESGIKPKGFGTERIEDELAVLFPEVKVIRLDTDNTTSRHSFEKRLSDFAEGKASILVGTQMVSKGLDFANVSLVGIMNADNMLHFPDFRAHERTFQMLSQVAGRAGRKGDQGMVILQTSSPDSSVIEMVEKNDYEAFFEIQSEERQMFSYPPYYRLIKITIRHKREEALQKAVESFYTKLREQLGNRVLAPHEPPVNRIQLYYIKQMVIKVEKSVSTIAVKKHILEAMKATQAERGNGSAIFGIDVDPA